MLAYLVRFYYVSKDWNVTEYAVSLPLSHMVELFSTALSIDQISVVWFFIIDTVAMKLQRMYNRCFYTQSCCIFLIKLPCNCKECITGLFIYRAVVFSESSGHEITKNVSRCFCTQSCCIIWIKLSCNYQECKTGVSICRAESSCHAITKNV